MVGLNASRSRVSVDHSQDEEEGDLPRRGGERALLRVRRGESPHPEAETRRVSAKAVSKDEEAGGRREGWNATRFTGAVSQA
jgi:hypothetical protein